MMKAYMCVFEYMCKEFVFVGLFAVIRVKVGKGGRAHLPTLLTYSPKDVVGCREE